MPITKKALKMAKQAKALYKRRRPLREVVRGATDRSKEWLPPHPDQAVYVVFEEGVRARGRLRFRPNEIVRYLLDAGGIDLNQLAKIPFDREDRDQFYQLIGYSLIGYSELADGGVVSQGAIERMQIAFDLDQVLCDAAKEKKASPSTATMKSGGASYKVGPKGRRRRAP